MAISARAASRIPVRCTPLATFEAWWSCDAELVAMSASNWLSLAPPEVLAQLADDPNVWPAFLDWEERFCAEPGAVDGGTHLLFAWRRV
jgi:hypothetical protein